MTITATRSKIRHYVSNLVKQNVDVNPDHVFTSNPSSRFLEELPAVCIYYASEGAEVLSGSNFARVREYQRNLELVISIVVDGSHDDSDDRLDYLGEQVERAMFYDWRLAQNLPDFDPDSNMVGLTLGSRLKSVTPYSIETDNARRMAAQDISFILPYRTPGYIDTRYRTFEEYKADIIRVGSNESTTDRVLISAEGVLNNG